MKNIFKMPKAVKIAGRTSSITNAFINGIVPCIQPTDEEIHEALRYLDMNKNNISCAYCGDPHNQWDHLEPIVKEQRPTGYISEIYNLIPCCSTCNSSKSGSNWRIWMEGNSPQNPKSRGIKDINKRVLNIEKYEKWCKEYRKKIDFEEIVGKKDWDIHWENHDILIEKMRSYQSHSNILRKKIQFWVENETSKNCD